MNGKYIQQEEMFNINTRIFFTLKKRRKLNLILRLFQVLYYKLEWAML